MDIRTHLEGPSMLDRYLENLSVVVDPFAVCMLDGGWRLSLPGPPCAMLHFVVEGEGWLSAPDGTHTRVGPNWLVVVPNGMMHSIESCEDFQRELKIDCTPTGPPVHYIRAGEDGPVDMVVGCGILNVRFRETVGLFDRLTELLIVDLSHIPAVPALFRSMLQEQEHGGPGMPVLQGAIMTQLLVHMFRELAKQSDEKLAWLRALEDPRLARAVDLILENPAAPHSVESLADAAHMSRSAFARQFNHAFHSSPMQMVNHVRLERAARMLAGSKLPVKQVASRCGFASRSHFTNVFKRHAGIPPGDYRNLAGGQGAEPAPQPGKSLHG